MAALEGPTEAGGRQVILFVEPGGNVAVEVRGVGPLAKRELRAWLRLEEEVRVSRSMVPELEERVLRGFEEDGHPEAIVVITHQQEVDGHVLAEAHEVVAAAAVAVAAAAQQVERVVRQPPAFLDRDADPARIRPRCGLG